MERVRDGAYNYKGASELPALLICRFLFRVAAVSCAFACVFVCICVHSDARVRVWVLL